MQIHEAAEMYLETILVLHNRTGAVRSVDIAREMQYSKPTVSVMMKALREDGYIVVDDEGYITLTEKGAAIATRIYERHTVVSALLMKLGVSEENAVADACKIEHDVSEETFEKLKKYYNSL